MNSKSLKPLLFIAPSFILAFLIISYPIIDLIRLSLNDVGTFGEMNGFIGLLNYQDVFEEELFFEVLLRTFYWTVSVVIGTVAISVPIALALNEDFYGKGIARTIIMLPWAISLAMTAVIWKWMLNPDYGMLNHFLMSIGLIDENIGWLADASTAFPMQILIGILVSIPFTISILLGGLTSIPTDIYEAAYLDGSSYFQRLRTLTLPLLKPFINIAVVLNVIYVFNSFPIIWILTEGGPSNSTDILPTYLYKMAFQFGEIGLAAAVSIIMLAILLGFTFVYAYVSMREKKVES
ncbi:MAG: sugar ABC transporter permease [Campylobacteraceae bacterium]|nr:sugar ABC transporter permease [Campylobacteraceae bacterium]